MSTARDPAKLPSLLDKPLYQCVAGGISGVRGKISELFSHFPKKPVLQSFQLAERQHLVLVRVLAMPQDEVYDSALFLLSDGQPRDPFELGLQVITEVVVVIVQAHRIYLDDIELIFLKDGKGLFREMAYLFGKIVYHGIEYDRLSLILD